MMRKGNLTVCIQAVVPDDLDSAELCLDMQPTDFRLGTVTGANVEGEILDFCTENVEYIPE